MTAGAAAAGYVVVPEPRPDAETVLVCAPYAGGGASLFRDWPARLPGVEVLALQLPGRERRFHEPPLRRVTDVVAAAVPELAPRLDRSFSLFGHSMGALIVFEVARELRRRFAASPSALFVSGARAPQLPSARRTYNLPDNELAGDIAWPHAAEGEPIPASEILELMLPLVRADLELAQTYEHRPEPPFRCPIVAFCGTADAEVTVEDAAAWRAHTVGRFALHVLEGNHLFLHSAQSRLLDLIASELAAPSQPLGAAQL
jgi:medium-chain acyl-[acyl-carrier-protein] hydrolase